MNKFFHGVGVGATIAVVIFVIAASCLAVADHFTLGAVETGLRHVYEFLSRTAG